VLSGGSPGDIPIESIALELGDAENAGFTRAVAEAVPGRL
jgi:hypothetical protein